MKKYFWAVFIWLSVVLGFPVVCLADIGVSTSVAPQVTARIPSPAEQHLSSSEFTNPESAIPKQNEETGQDVQQSFANGYIYVGDSRYIGLDMYTGLSKIPNVWMVAKVAKGYGWLKGEAQNQINNIEATNPQVTKWYEVYTLGINDPGNMGKYAEWYLQRALSGHNVVLVSVNPIEHHSSITNELISNFNQTIAATGLPYIDSYSYLMEKGFKTADGVHFTKSTNQLVNAYVTIMLKSYAGEL